MKSASVGAAREISKAADDHGKGAWAKPTVGDALSQWSLVVAAAAGLTYFLGMALLALRLYNKYRLAPTAILARLPNAFVLQNGVMVVVPSAVLALACRPVIKYYRQGWSAPGLAGVIILALLCASVSPLVSHVTHKRAIVSNVDKILITGLPALAGLLGGWFLLTRLDRSPVRIVSGVRATAEVIVATVCMSFLVAACWAAVPFPVAQVCFVDGEHYQYSFLDETSDSVYLVGLDYRRSVGHKPLDGSEFLWVIPRSEVRSTLVGNRFTYLSCRPRRFQ